MQGGLDQGGRVRWERLEHFDAAAEGVLPDDVEVGDN